MSLQLDAVPRLNLGTWPTPVEQKTFPQFARLASTDLWIKRDDLAGSGYGGNKVRSLEFILADALSQNAKNLITIGGSGSNQVIATAFYAQRWSLATHAICVPQPATSVALTNVQKMHRLGVIVVPCRYRAAVPAYLLKLRLQLDRPYFIPPGGASPLGVIGYIAAAFELKAQIDQKQLPEPDQIVLPFGSGATTAGLAIGCALAGLKTTIFAVRVAERWLTNKTYLQFLIWRSVRLLKQIDVTVHVADLCRNAANRVLVHHNHLGHGYGHPLSGSEHLIQCCHSCGLTLDPTYSGKAFAALVDGPQLGKTILFWSTFNSQP